MNEKYDLCDIDESYLHTVSMTELFDSADHRRLALPGNISFRRLSEDRQEFFDGTACLSRQHRHKPVGL